MEPLSRDIRGAVSPLATTSGAAPLAGVHCVVAIEKPVCGPVTWHFLDHAMSIESKPVKSICSVTVSCPLATHAMRTRTDAPTAGVTVPIAVTRSTVDVSSVVFVLDAEAKKSCDTPVVLKPPTSVTKTSSHGKL